MSNDTWEIYHGTGQPHPWELPPPPSWRPFGQESRPGVSRRKQRGQTFQARPAEIQMVNAALYLRRPLLITGKPGTGKSSLVYSVAQELGLGEVLYWSITTRTTLKDGLYSYDAIGRLQDAKGLFDNEDDPDNNSVTRDLSKIGKYITLGPLGTALLPATTPRVLLIDEIDKSDIDLPNDLLTIFEEGSFEIPELTRIKDQLQSVDIRTAYTDPDESTTWSSNSTTVNDGRVTCSTFPLVILTSNGERDFPPPFLRRCLRLKMELPDETELTRIVKAHLDSDLAQQLEEIERDQGSEAAAAHRQSIEQERQALISTFLNKRSGGDLSTDQLLNVIFMMTRGQAPVGNDKQNLIDALLKRLSSAED